MNFKNIDWSLIGWGALGAGSKGLITGIVSRFVPIGNISPNIATGVVGLLLATQGERVSAMGVGLLLSSIGDMIETPIAQLANIGRLTTTKTNNTGNTSENDAMTAYMLANYGVVV